MAFRTGSDRLEVVFARETILVMKRHPQVDITTGERIVVPARKAVHTDQGRKAGGKLLITDRRLIFNTNFLDSWFFASVAMDLADISSVDVASRSYNAYDGGLARRLDIHLHDGSEHLFVLASGGVGQYADHLNVLINQSAADRPVSS
jgi:hypothetical protein